jgi:putative transposase
MFIISTRAYSIRRQGKRPSHSSWLNQVEIWFSILVRRLLARLNCVSVEQLHAQILVFITYYNQTSKGAFHWTYKGPPDRS